MAPAKLLNADQLYHATDAKLLKFKTTEELEVLTEVIGQPRAVESVKFGVGMHSEGYNLFALGPAGTGKRSLLKRSFAEQAAGEPVPADWIYVNNFDVRHQPHAIELPAGVGSSFGEAMDQLIDELQSALSSAFESEDYQSRRQEIQEEFQTKQEEKLDELRKKASQEGLALLRTPGGLIFAPLRGEEVISPEEYQGLPEEEREVIEARVEALQEDLQKTLNQIPRWQREVQEALLELNREMANLTVGVFFGDLRQSFSDHEALITHLERLEQDVIENANDFLQTDEQVGPPMGFFLDNASPRRNPAESSLRRYKVNVIIDQSEAEQAPVVYEDNPTYQNLLGRIEYQPQLGALITDFNMIKPGALHQANGGYLILDARKVLLEPFAWEGLKRAIESEQIRIESPTQSYSFINTVTLEPEPVELNIKVALLGDPTLYYLLSSADPEFDQLFKVMVDFDERMDRSKENQMLYARLIASICRKETLMPFDTSAVARVIEHSARMVGDAEKLSTRMRNVVDLLREADYWAGQNNHKAVTAVDVQNALDAKTYRSDRLKERIQESILRETILVETEGEKEGQINGLSVMQLGGYAFGRPSKITARIRLGQGDVVNIEREVEMSGPLHSKGVLILAGFLGARYAAERPLSLAASLVFEQSYGGVDGDSASSTELYALLSAIAGVPIKQSLAVTGSVNQHGLVQAIGGVNEKIEGFFDVCAARGLTGDQGVLIPESNVKHLMLRADVIEAVERGEFAIYAVTTIDEGIEVLTGLAAGEADEDGNYPQDTINGRVQRRLQAMAEKRLEYTSPRANPNE